MKERRERERRRRDKEREREIRATHKRKQEIRHCHYGLSFYIMGYTHWPYICIHNLTAADVQ